MKAKDGVVPYMIVKPSESCQGKGIFFVNDFDKLKEMLSGGDKQKSENTKNFVV